MTSHEKTRYPRGAACYKLRDVGQEHFVLIITLFILLFSFPDLLIRTARCRVPVTTTQKPLPGFGFQKPEALPRWAVEENC